jgi:hypothetical protein
MRFWWVNHKQTARHERSGGFSEARANIVWDFDVTFDDTGTGSGTFTVDTDDFLLDGANSATTTAGTTLPGDTYNDTIVAPSINNPADDTVTFYSSTHAYAGTLVLEFAHALTTPGVDPIIGSVGGPSFECAVGFSCGSTTPTRYVLTGSATGVVPEPATWAMMLLGFAGLGFVGYRRARAGRAALPGNPPMDVTTAREAGPGRCRRAHRWREQGVRLLADAATARRFPQPGIELLGRSRTRSRLHRRAPA